MECDWLLFIEYYSYGYYGDCLAECWFVIGYFSEYYLDGNSVIGRADLGARFGCVLGET